jgi:predicted dithiol-disulfide oxidoreductase (DUF899 family)
MTQHRVVTKEAWIEERKALLAAEKEQSRLRDELSRKRRELPWVKIDKSYTFEGPKGKETLADLFAGRGQLVVYHFMFDPGWEAGCKSCSYLTDHYQLAIEHLAQRDVTLVAVSRAPLAKLEAFKKRMGWTHEWVSSYDSDFNFDFDVSFSADDLANGEVYYNYATSTFPSTEAPGLSVFIKDGGAVYHTYSTYARGLDVLIGTYNFLDLVPNGRGEDADPYPMAWVRLRDQY